MTAFTFTTIVLSIILYLVQLGMVIEHLVADKYKTLRDFWIDVIPAIPIPRYIIKHYKRLLLRDELKKKVKPEVMEKLMSKETLEDIGGMENLKEFIFKGDK